MGGGDSEIPKIRFVEFVIKETKKGVTGRSLCPRKFIWSGLGLVCFLLFENKKRCGVGGVKALSLTLQIRNISGTTTTKVEPMCSF